MNRRKNPIVSRRRGPVDDEDETLNPEDSFTDDSGISESEDGDREEDDGATDGTLSEDDVDQDQADAGGKTDGGRKVGRGGGKKDQAKALLHGKDGDTEMMLNGMPEDVGETEEVDYEAMGKDLKKVEATGEVKGAEQGEVAPVVEMAAPQTQYEKMRGDHEEYKKRRAADPAFVPDRGAFFMHDRRDGNGGFRPFARGGRGGGGGGRGARSSGEFMPRSEPADNQWTHDMHEQVVSAERRPQAAYNNNHNNNHNNHSFVNNRARGGAEAPRSFGRIYHKGTTQINVKLPGMKFPITFSEVPCKIYTRLPYHRPPLRRDKPVRIALPDAPVRYIYPSPIRSFIFIPRAMRPGGSGYIRGNGGRGRGSYGYHGGFNGGRSAYAASGYGGSTVYTPSVGMSRRSSLQFEVKPQFETPVSTLPQSRPAPPIMSAEQNVSSRPSPAEEERRPIKPVVRLPMTPAAQPPPPSPPPVQAMPPVAPQQSVNMAPQSSTPKVVPQYPPPSYTPTINPTAYREHRATPKIPMHQPRPQKAVNVAEIDSPAMMHFPQNYNPGAYPENIPTPGVPPTMYAHNRHPSYPSQTSGTPLSQIPEASIHGRQFQPSLYSSQGPYYTYPPHQHAFPHMSHPMPPHPHQHMTHDPRVFHPPPPPYVPSGPSPLPNGTTQHYAVPMPAPIPQPVAQPPPQPAPQTIAQESNGMVYYSTWDPNQYYGYPGVGTPQGYPGTPGMPITPAPDGGIITPGAHPGGGAVYYYPANGAPQQSLYYGQ